MKDHVGEHKISAIVDMLFLMLVLRDIAFVLSTHGNISDILSVDTQHELDTVQQVKEEIEELREYVDRLEEHSHRRKLRLLEQVTASFRHRCFLTFYYVSIS